MDQMLSKTGPLFAPHFIKSAIELGRAAGFIAAVRRLNVAARRTDV
jgi:hypothetical protein